MRTVLLIGAALVALSGCDAVNLKRQPPNSVYVAGITVERDTWTCRLSYSHGPGMPVVRTFVISAKSSPFSKAGDPHGKHNRKYEMCAGRHVGDWVPLSSVS